MATIRKRAAEDETTVNLRLRNRFAAWILEALEDPGAGSRIEALAAFARHADDGGFANGLGVADEEVLAAAEEFERAGGGIRLRTELLADLPEIRRRAKRFADALRATRAGCGAPLRGVASLEWTLCAAAALFDARLFFEVHELLEEPWEAAEGAPRTFLQGLIQIAVGFHHHAAGNTRGAIGLLVQGSAKLRPFAPEAHGIDIGGLLVAVDGFVTRLRGADPPGDLAPPRLVFRQRGSAITW